MKSLPILISSAAFILSFVNFLFSRRYTRINVFNTIQKMVLEKAKDCNTLYRNEYDKWITNLPNRSSSDEPNYRPVISEILISIQILDLSLAEYKQVEKREFFLTLFWIQLDMRLRENLKKMNTFQDRETIKLKHEIETIHVVFSSLFSTY